MYVIEVAEPGNTFARLLNLKKNSVPSNCFVHASRSHARQQPKQSKVEQACSSACMDVLHRRSKQIKPMAVFLILTRSAYLQLSSLFLTEQVVFKHLYKVLSCNPVLFCKYYFQ